MICNVGDSDLISKSVLAAYSVELFLIFICTKEILNNIIRLVL